MPFAASVSQHPVTAMAVGEAVGDVLDRMGGPIDLAVVFVTPHHIGALEDAAAAVRTLLSPTTLIGCAAVSVAGPRVEVEEGPGVSLWVARFAGDVVPVRLDGPPGFDDQALSGWPAELPFDPVCAVLLGDPFTFPVEAALDELGRRHPGLPVIGGMASAARQPGGNRLALDGAIHTSGAVGAIIGPGVDVTTIVSQGCRPIGSPLVVTRAERNVIYELAGRSPIARLEELAAGELDEDDIALVNRGGLHVGVVVDEHKEAFDTGDFLVRNVLGADRENGAIAIGDRVEVGQTVQFQVRDAASADAELRRLLADHDHPVDAALLFTCNGRGARLFGEPDHDAGLLADAFDDPPAAGFFCAGELGPVGGRNALHGFTASIALFRD